MSIVLKVGKLRRHRTDKLLDAMSVNHAVRLEEEEEAAAVTTRDDLQYSTDCDFERGLN
jgi:hypothetical protein